MLSKMILGISLVGAEWVLWFLLGLSIYSIGLIIERALFFRNAKKNIRKFRQDIRNFAQKSEWDKAHGAAKSYIGQKDKPDFDSEVAIAIFEHRAHNGSKSPAVLAEIGEDAIQRTKVAWEHNLAILATIGANAPFVGLFGTVLGIVEAFRVLSEQAGTGVQTITSGISEALIATGVGIFVAIPAVVAFNLFNRQVKAALGEAEALKSFIIAKLSE